MVWEEILCLYNMGWSIQSHGWSHTALQLLKLEEKEYEISKSTSDIYQHSGVCPRYYAYPFGGYDEDVKNIIIKEGYLGAVTVNKGIENIQTVDLYRIKRIGVKSKYSARLLKKKLASR